MSRDVVVSKAVLSAADMSGDLISEITGVVRQDNISYQVVWSGTGLSGEFFVDCTNDNPSDPNSTPIWSELDFGLQILVASDTGDDLININQCPFRFIRLRYESTSGTGTVTAKVTSKQLGGS